MAKVDINKREGQFTKENLWLIKKKERESKYMRSINIIKDNGKMDINMDKGSYNFQMVAIVKGIFKKILSMDSLSINGLGRRNSLETGF
jgi:hypothetical protein